LREHPDGAEEVEPTPEPQPQASAEQVVEELLQPQVPAEISFRNGLALRVSFLAALVIELVRNLAVYAAGLLMMPIVLFAGGIYAVVLYKRRTGFPVNVVAGARLGWITGVFTFLVSTVITTFSMASLAMNNSLLDTFKKSAESMGLPADASRQMQEVMSNPTAFALLLLLVMAVQFVLLTVLCSMGGALGARFLFRNEPRA
jgi:hypothetical protein